ncbi:MAG: hypothetical protein ACLQGP_14370 [Isosphaeraceae bacterium]
MLPNPALTIEETPLSDEVRAFCERHALFGHLAKALELARQYFTIIGEPVIQWDQDPENDDEYLIIEIQALGSVSEVVEAHGRYIRAWLKFATLPEIRLIRLIPRSS